MARFGGERDWRDSVGDEAADPYYSGGGHTGDPARDIEFERNERSGFIIAGPIKEFLLQFQKAIAEQNVFEIQKAYEVDFNDLTDRFFKDKPWPHADTVSPIVNDDQKFLMLYNELYFRHIYARIRDGPTLEQRLESYYNYCNIFNFILTHGETDGPPPLELPNQWLWDIIDEFIYQFQSYSHYRVKLHKRTQDEIATMAEYPKIWNVHSVLNVLHSLVEKSNINLQLEVYSSGGDPNQVAGDFGRHALYKMLGYFSLVGLLRLHSLLGDYYQALKVMENIDFNKNAMYSRVPQCHITTYYYVGFAYMMMRRYQDAIRTLTHILTYIQRTKSQFQNKNYLYDQINKQNDQLHTLLAICLVLHPTSIDETIDAQLREHYMDKMIKMGKGDAQEFESCFSFSCPKFLSPVPPNFEICDPNTYLEPFKQQLTVFLSEVTQQALIPTIRSYLKLYTTLPIGKLAAFMDMGERELKTHLMCFKHKMKNVVWSKGVSGLDGEFQSCSELDFYIDKDMIHIADTKVSRRYGDFFIRQIHKFEELNRSLKQIKPKPETASH